MSFLGIIAKASQNKFYQNWISKSKFIHVQIPVPKWEKRKSEEKFCGLQNEAIGGLQIGARFRDYKSGQEGFQIGAEITNWGRYYESVQNSCAFVMQSLGKKTSFIQRIQFYKQ